LALGADDYLTKPFGMLELVARIRTCLRHAAAMTRNHKPAVLVVGNLQIDLARHRVTVDGKLVELSPTEFQLLAYLAQHRGQVIDHRTLLREVWGPEYCDQIDYLHLYVRYLRKKIEADPAHPAIIKTERGVGYYVEES
jgi:two-component system KDP operon response regulator KdpE